MTTRERQRLDRTVRPIPLLVIDGMAKCPGCTQQVRVFPKEVIGIRLPFNADGWVVHHLNGEYQCTHSGQNIYSKTMTQAESDALSRATRDSFQEHMDKLTVQPEGFREWPVDYFDATELQDSDSYKDFVNQQS